MRKILFTAFLALYSISLFGRNPNVLYGERNLDLDTASIYFDKEGSIYPAVRIADDELKNANNSLKEWYSKNEEKFIEIGRLYSCDFDTYSDSNYEILNEAIMQVVIKNLNAAPNSSLTFLIHGFRKPFKPTQYDTSSPEDYETMITSFHKFNTANTKMITVYWDALYDCCFSGNPKRNKPLFKLFERSQKNAEYTGNSLKRILGQISKDTVNIITHSLGAKVAVYSVLNISDSPFNTPSNKRVNICLIAPAISADLISKNYEKRIPEADLSLSDNYHLYIAYNENDFVLKKKDDRWGLFGPGPFKYGETTLGFNYKRAAIKLQSQFKTLFEHSSIQLYDVSYVGKCHLVSCYCYEDNLEDIFMDMQ